MGQVSGEKQFFAEMVVDAVNSLDSKVMDLSLLGIKKVISFPVCVGVCVYGRGGGRALGGDGQIKWTFNAGSMTIHFSKCFA